MTEVFIKSKGKSAFATVTEGFGSAANAYQSRMDPTLALADLTDAQINLLQDQGFEVHKVTRYQSFAPKPAAVSIRPHDYTMRDVMTHIRADQAWGISRGEGVHIAVIDKGVCGSMPEFPASKRFAGPAQSHRDPWIDTDGHGSMVAGIATATSQFGGRFDGVAPDAKLISCPSTFSDSDVLKIYEYLIGLVEDGHVRRLVVCNSYTYEKCTPVDMHPELHPLPKVIREAESMGIVIVYAAGNNHVDVCGNPPDACGEDSIWGVNSMDEVITVGTVDRDNRMDRPPMPGSNRSHRDSSRGPGQFSHAHDKPDCVAPAYGETLWGCGYEWMEWWGTSGAAPQVAGLAALLLARNPDLSSADVKAAIRGGCVGLPLAPTCAGAGVIDCLAAVSSV